jgi:hypothetical protein
MPRPLRLTLGSSGGPPYCAGSATNPAGLRKERSPIKPSSRGELSDLNHQQPAARSGRPRRPLPGLVGSELLRRRLGRCGRYRLSTAPHLPGVVLVWRNTTAWPSTPPSRSGTATQDLPSTGPSANPSRSSAPPTPGHSAAPSATTDHPLYPVSLRLSGRPANGSATACVRTTVALPIAVRAGVGVCSLTRRTGWRSCRVARGLQN